MKSICFCSEGRWCYILFRLGSPPSVRTVHSCYSAVPNYGISLHPTPFQFCPLWTWLWMCGSSFALAWYNNLREAQTLRTPPTASVKGTALVSPSEAQHCDHFSRNCCPDLIPVLNSSFGVLTVIKNCALSFCACHRNKQGSTVDFTRANGLTIASTFLLLICMQQIEVLRKLQCCVLTQCNSETLRKALWRPKWESVICFLLAHFPLPLPITLLERRLCFTPPLFWIIWIRTGSCCASCFNQNRQQ